MLWTVLYYVNPATIVMSLLLSLVAAIFLAHLRPPMRMITIVMAIVYLVVLAAPMPGQAGIGDGNRSVTWDPTLSMQDISGPPDYPADFGITLDDGRIIRYSSEGLAGEERQIWVEPGVETVFVHGDPDIGLTVTDMAGSRVKSSKFIEIIEEELEQQKAYAIQLEEEGPWGHGYGMALQERVLNALIFVPIGILAYFAFSSWAARVFFGPGLTIAVEFTQWALASGRVADTGDVIVNSMGSAVGNMLALGAVGIIFLVQSQSKKTSLKRMKNLWAGWKFPPGGPVSLFHPEGAGHRLAPTTRNLP